MTDHYKPTNETRAQRIDIAMQAYSLTLEGRDLVNGIQFELFKN